jgi:hypothetical protein
LRTKERFRETEKFPTPEKASFLYTAAESEKSLEAFDCVRTFRSSECSGFVDESFAMIKLRDFAKATGILERLNEKNSDPDLSFCLLGFAVQGSKILKIPESLKEAIEADPKKPCPKRLWLKFYLRIGNSMGAVKELEVQLQKPTKCIFNT